MTAADEVEGIPVPGEEPVSAADLSISIRERFLGVVVVIHPQAMHNELYHGRHHGGLDGEPEVNAVGSDHPVWPRDRAYIARWARSALFDGAKPRRDADGD